MLWPKHLLFITQDLSVHGFSLFILALAVKDPSKVIDDAECVWMLWPKHFL